MPGNGRNRVVLILESRRNTHLVCISSKPNTAAREMQHVSSHIMEKYLRKNHSHPWCRSVPGPGRWRRGRPSRDHTPARRGRSTAEQMKKKTCDEEVEVWWTRHASTFELRAWKKKICHIHLKGAPHWYPFQGSCINVSPSGNPLTWTIHGIYDMAMSILYPLCCFYSTRRPRNFSLGLWAQGPWAQDQARVPRTIISPK